MVKRKRKYYKGKKVMRGGGGGDAGSTTSKKLTSGELEDIRRGEGGGFALPQTEFKEIEQLMGQVDDYMNVDEKFLNYAMIAWAIMGLIWFFISRKLIKHKYNDALCYGLLTVSLIISLLSLLMFVFKRLPTASQDGPFKKILKGILYIMKNGVPGFLILAQLILLIYIFIKHGEYLFIAQIPDTLFYVNTAAAMLIAIQLWIWRTHLIKLIHSPIDTVSSDYVLLFGFIIVSIMSGLAISQIYIILDYLKTDC